MAVCPSAHERIRLQDLDRWRGGRLQLPHSTKYRHRREPHSEHCAAVAATDARMEHAPGKSRHSTQSNGLPLSLRIPVTYPANLLADSSVPAARAQAGA